MAFLMCIGSCSNRKQTETTEEILPSNEIMEDGVRSLKSSVVRDTINWNGDIVYYEINREPDNSLPKISDEENNMKFYDNVITLTIWKEDAVIFKRKFLKSTFAQFLDKDFKKHSILEGMVFMGVKNKNMEFTTSISYPHSDLFVPLLISISPSGDVEIHEDKIMDMNI